MTVNIRMLNADDEELMRKLLVTFGKAFDEDKTYCQNQPDSSYLRKLLSGDYFIAIVALAGQEVIGGIAAYELKKFEQRRSEIYIYDLAVSEAHRRKGVATALIEELKQIAATRSAHVIFVQADRSDGPAIAFTLRWALVKMYCILI